MKCNFTQICNLMNFVHTLMNFVPVDKVLFLNDILLNHDYIAPCETNSQGDSNKFPSIIKYYYINTQE